MGAEPSEHAVQADDAQTDVAIIGAGPAGLAAAAVAAGQGVTVTVLDEQTEAGGQIYRAVGSVTQRRARVLGADYIAGASLLTALSAENVTHIGAATVWEVTRDRTLYYSAGGIAKRLSARRIIIATGATERPMPIPGWTLPGVMNAGAAQILLKRSGLLPAQPVVLAGSGPLLYLVAVQMLDAGVPPAAILDTTPAGNRRAALRHLPGAMSGHRLIGKGLGLLARIRRAGVPHHRGVTALSATGDARIREVRFTSPRGQHSIACSTLLLHTGVVPNVQISRSLGLDHRWDDTQACWHPVVDESGTTDIDGIHIAGDGAGIAGADAAVSRGRLAALASLSGLDTAVPVDPAAITAERQRLQRLTGVRPFLDTLYAPASWLLSPADDTIVCRCEEVTAGQIRDYVRLGCLGPNQAKSYGRCGMGPCQGRYCGLTVSQVIAEARGVPLDAVGYYRLRPPLKPVSLGELASLPDAEDADHVG